MEKFKHWYITNQDAITWFIVGVMVDQCIYQLGRGDYSGAALSAVLAGINVYFNKVRL